MNYFTLDQVSKQYDGNWVLKKASLAVHEGEVLTILGPSGAGKSVTLRLLVGLEKQDEGRIFIKDREITALPEKDLYPIRMTIGFLFQGGALFDSLTAFENVAFPLREHLAIPEEELKERVREKLRWVGLEKAEDRFPSELSGGMQKRLALARAMAMEPEAILYDEPTTGLDPPTAETINQLILRLNRERGITSVVVTHDLHCATQISHRIALLRDGQFPIVEEKSTFLSYQDSLIQAFLEASEVCYDT